MWTLGGLMSQSALRDIRRNNNCSAVLFLFQECSMQRVLVLEVTQQASVLLDTECPGAFDKRSRSSSATESQAGTSVLKDEDISVTH